MTRETLLHLQLHDSNYHLLAIENCKHIQIAIREHFSNYILSDFCSFEFRTDLLLQIMDGLKL